jgi:hypothetical protein
LIDFVIVEREEKRISPKGKVVLRQTIFRSVWVWRGRGVENEKVVIGFKY